MHLKIGHGHEESGAHIGFAPNNQADLLYRPVEKKKEDDPFGLL